MPKVKMWGVFDPDGEMIQTNIRRVEAARYLGSGQFWHEEQQRARREGWRIKSVAITWAKPAPAKGEVA